MSRTTSTVNIIKKSSFVVVTFLILFCILSIFRIEIFQIKNLQNELDTVVQVISDEEFEKFPLVNCHTEIDENGNMLYVPDNEDPQVYLSVPNNAINCIKVNFNSEISNASAVQVYYAKEGEYLSESNQSISTITGASTLIYLPNAVYTILRLDITGEYAIRSVELGVVELADKFVYPIYNRFYIINYFAIGLLVITIILLFIFEKKYGYIAAIRYVAKRYIDKLVSLKFFRKFKKVFFSENDYSIQETSNAFKVANTFTALALIFGVLLVFLVPPSSTPDEPAHFQNICRMTAGNFFANKSDEGYGSIIHDEDQLFINDTSTNYKFDIHKYSFSTLLAYKSTYNYRSDSSLYITPYSSINPMSYLSSVCGVLIVKGVFGISNTYDLLIWARLSNLIFYIFVIRLAILKTPILRNTMFLLALMPQTFYQCCSVSYDVEAICGSFLLFAYGSKLILSEKEYRVKTKDIIAVCFSCACLFSAKLIYIILALILFSINVKKFGSMKRYIFSISSVVLMGVIFYIIPTTITDHIIGNIPNSSAATEQIKYLIFHPDIVPSVMINTFRTLGGFYTASFIGYFGWLNVSMPLPFTELYLLVLAFVVIIETCSIRNLTKLPRLLNFISVALVVHVIVFSMYIYHSTLDGTINHQYAAGVQGRYFIPVAIFMPLFLGNPLLCKFKFTTKAHEVSRLISKYIAAAYMLLTCAIILTAYWI